MTDIVVVVTGLVQPGMQEYMAEFFGRLMQASQTHEGCRFYHIYQSLVNPGEFLAISRWRSRADFEAHNQTPILQEFKTHLVNQQLIEQTPKTYWRPLEAE